MNVIAVDDECLALETLVDSIEKSLSEAQVYGFSKPEQALEFVSENGAEIAFLDIKMRGMTGLELAKRLKDINGDINIVFVTGYSEYTLDAFRLYASDYILKPATPEAVKTATPEYIMATRLTPAKKSNLKTAFVRARALPFTTIRFRPRFCKTAK